jgi:hypothetical protein
VIVLVVHVRDIRPDKSEGHSTRKSASARMCRSTSRGSYDIHGVREDVRAQERRQALGRDELDMSSEHRLEEIPEVDEVCERLLLRFKLDEQVDVTVRTRCAPTD